MKVYTSRRNIFLTAAILLSCVGILCAQPRGAEPADQPGQPWSIGAGGGWICYEGDEATRDGGSLFLRVSRDYSPRWTFRGDINYLPCLKSNSVYNYESGAPRPRPGLHADSTWALGVSCDALFHLRSGQNRRWDPYLIGGIGLLAYADTRQWRSQVDVPVRAGAGLAYHVTDEWAINLDAMGQMTIDKTEFNFIPSAGITWKWGSETRPSAGAAAVPSAPPAAPTIPPVPPENILQAFEVDMNIDEGAWRPEYLSELNAVAKAIQAHPDSNVRIEGHIDRQPRYSEQDALKLTEKRARDVRNYLVEKHGIAEKRITAVGLGFSRPKKPDASGSISPENRRMAILILAPGR